MIKRTLYFGNPSYLSIKNTQLAIRMPEVESSVSSSLSTRAESREENITAFKRDALTTIPVEDIGIVIIDHPQITLTSGLLQALQENNVAVIICDYRHMPQSLVLPIEGNSIQQERYDNQLAATSH
jgi:CRISPR-associated protein Cas1